MMYSKTWIKGKECRKLVHEILAKTLKKDQLKAQDLYRVVMSKSTTHRCLNELVRLGLLEKFTIGRKSRPAFYRITPAGLSYLILHESLLVSANIAENFKEFIQSSSTEDILSFFRGIFEGITFSFLYNLLFISKGMYKSDELVRKNVVSILKSKYKIPMNESTENKLRLIVTYILEISKSIGDSPKEIRKLKKLPKWLENLILKLKHLQEEEVEDYVKIILNTCTNYLTNIMESGYIQELLEELLRRPDLPEKVREHLEPYFEQIKSKIEISKKFPEAEQIKLKDKSLVDYLSDAIRGLEDHIKEN